MGFLKKTKPMPLFDFQEEGQQVVSFFKKTAHRKAVYHFCLKGNCLEMYVAYLCIVYMENNPYMIRQDTLVIFIRLFLQDKDKKNGISEGYFCLNLGAINGDHRYAVIAKKELYRHYKDNTIETLEKAEIDELLGDIKKAVVKMLKKALFEGSNNDPRITDSYSLNKKYTNTKAGKDLKKYTFRKYIQSFPSSVREEIKSSFTYAVNNLKAVGFPIDYIFMGVDLK